MAPTGLPPGTPENFAWFASWIAEQFGKLEGKIDALSKEFITRREFESLQQDISRAHQKVRELRVIEIDELEDRVKLLEDARIVSETNEKARFTMGEKVLGGVFLLIQVAISIWAAISK